MDYTTDATAPPRTVARTVSRPRPTKRKRRSRADIDALKANIYEVVQADRPMTVRQVFYRLVSAGVIRKAESEYKTTVVRLLTAMRRDGELPYRWIADNTRWMRRPKTYSGLDDLLGQTAKLYRRSTWDNQHAYVEAWLEKDALSGVLYRETERYDVPLMVTRGYPSLSYLHSAGMAIREIQKPVFLYYFGDHDPSGIDIPRKVEAGIREFAPAADVQFRRVAVTPEQIDEWDLPTRPTKKTDSRVATFDGESVEVDAIPPKTLRRIVRECIEQHIDDAALDVLRVAEDSERDYLRRLAEMPREDGPEVF